MIFISGMKEGSGAGIAASYKAGWLAKRFAGDLSAAAARPPYLRGSVAIAPRPTIGSNGRPLPPDGSPAPPRPRTEVGSGGVAAPPTPNTNPPLAADGRPLPPVGPPPARRQSVPTAPVRPPSVSDPASRRTPGTPLPPGQGPSAPVGHSYVARPGPAPAGEFLVQVRCSCGGNRAAPVKLVDLQHAAERGLPAAEAIAIATQDALDSIHRRQ